MSLHTSSTAGCSTAVVMMCFFFGFALATPKIAVLLLSLAHEVNSICFGFPARSIFDTVLRASSMVCAAVLLASYIELGLKYSFVKNGCIALYTSGATAVVALLSTYTVCMFASTPT